MNRLLVAPWHGLISNSMIHLANGETRATRQPSNSPAATSGPGDTHKITVPGIEPLTPEEIAATPDGGQYRTGQALISGDQLYGVPGLSWIYQDEVGGKWSILMSNTSVSSTRAIVRLDFSRFGEFGAAPEQYSRGFIIPKGQPVADDLNRIFTLQGFNTGTVGLHAVSETGRTAIITLSAHNVPSNAANEAKTDTRRRNYCYIKFGLSGTGPAVTATMEVLFQGDAIYSSTELEFVGGSYQVPNVPGPSIEVDRVPLFDQGGQRYADRVSYDWATAVPMTSANQAPNNFRTSWRYSMLEKWLVRVVLDGETPVPCYLENLHRLDSSEMVFSLQTLQPFIQDEYLNGARVTIQQGNTLMTGGGSSISSSTLSWRGPGAPWSRVTAFSSDAFYDGAATHIADTRDGISEEYVQPFRTDMHYETFPLDTSFLPNFVGMPGVVNWRLVFYSNNLMAIIRTKDDNTATFDSVITAVEAVDHVAACPQDQGHFGTYNPITAEFVVGSPVPVNWA